MIDIDLFMKNNNDIIGWLSNLVQQEHVGDKGLIEALIASGFASGLGRKENAVHVWVTGEAQSGKSHAQNTVLKLFPRFDRLDDMSARVPVYRDYAHRSVLMIDDENIPQGGLQLLKMFTSPDDSIPVSEIVIDGEIRRFSFPHAVSVWRNSVRLCSDEQINSRFLLFRTGNSYEELVSFMQTMSRIADDELALAKEVVKRIVETDCSVIIPYAPTVVRATPRQYVFILNLLKAITYANRFSNRSFNLEAKAVVAQATDYEILKRLVENSELLSPNNLSPLDMRIYSYVRDNATIDRPVNLRAIAAFVGETEQVCRRRLARLDEYISHTRGDRGLFLYYLSRPLPTDSELVLPTEIYSEEANGSES